MRLGLHIGYWGLGMTAQEQLELVLEAERLGYDSVWTAEAYGSDAATILAWLAGRTDRIKLGSAIFHPEATRMVRLASGGRHGFAQALFQVGGYTGKRCRASCRRRSCSRIAGRSVSWA